MGIFCMNLFLNMSIISIYIHSDSLHYIYSESIQSILYFMIDMIIDQIKYLFT
jgi:hypothetical protein